LTHGGGSPARVNKPMSRIPGEVMLYGVVGLGAAIGGTARAGASMASVALWGPHLPVGTLFVNVLGSLLIGFYATLTGPDGRVFASPRQRQFFMAGFCGGLTTFSIFSLETLMLAHRGEFVVAAANIGVSVVAWLVAVWLGHRLAVRLNRLRGA
jgi:fluoride exporter